MPRGNRDFDLVDTFFFKAFYWRQCRTKGGGELPSARLPQHPRGQVQNTKQQQNHNHSMGGAMESMNCGRQRQALLITHSHPGFSTIQTVKIYHPVTLTHKSKTACPHQTQTDRRKIRASERGDMLEAVREEQTEKRLSPTARVAGTIKM